MTTTTTSRKHSQTIRRDLRSRMSTQRRMPRPNASATMTTAEPNVQQMPQLMLTYSEFLRNFDATPVSFNEDYRHRPSYAISPFDEVYTGPEPSMHSGFYPSDQREDFTREIRWANDPFGRERWVGHGGRIEEVDDEQEMTAGGVDESGNNQEHIIVTQKVQSISTAFASSSDDHHEGSIPQDDIPFDSMPSPVSRPRNPPSAKPTPTTSEYHSMKAISTSIPMSSPVKGNHSSLVLDDEAEVSLVKEVLDMLTISQEDVKFMNTFFLAKSREHEVSQHIDLCGHMEESLTSLRTSMNLRTAIGAEEWNVRSPSWHQKYCKRLMSLRTTLRRLSQMRELVEVHALHQRHKRSVLGKLEQHEAKLNDLASKFTIAFDRLRLRHLHFLLTQSHNEAKQQKELKRSRQLSRASFDRRWRDGKTLREMLRLNFNDLRQEFYKNAQRNPRHPSAP